MKRRVFLECLSSVPFMSWVVREPRGEFDTPPDRIGIGDSAPLTPMVVREGEEIIFCVKEDGTTAGDIDRAIEVTRDLEREYGSCGLALLLAIKNGPTK